MGQKYLIKPKLIHNLWMRSDSNPTVTYLTSLQGIYEVSTIDTERFMRFRTFCTGHNTVEKIAQISGTPIDEVQNTINSFNTINLIRPNEFELSLSESSKIIEKINDACVMWGEQLHDTHIFNDILNNKCTFRQFQGFLLETYHYIKSFPVAIYIAMKNSNDENLQQILYNYHKQEMGHEEFIIDALKDVGILRCEVETSIPLVSTQNIVNLIIQLFEKYPFAPLFLAKVIEEVDYNESNANTVESRINNIFNLSSNPMSHIHKHAKIDFDMKHYYLFDNYNQFIRLINHNDAHDILNRIHDIKHAFDLQKLEIKEYYSHDGNYLPRQKVDYFGV